MGGERVEHQLHCSMCWDDFKTDSVEEIISGEGIDCISPIDRAPIPQADITQSRYSRTCSIQEDLPEVSPAGIV